MTPRKYDRRSREAAAGETRRRIVSATAELHAAHGVLGTTHAMIAERAGVSLPTVYKYFPTRNDLVPHCTGLVLGAAPPLDESVFEGLRGAPARLRALARAVFAFHEYAAPWLRWSARDAAELPALRSVLEQAAAGRAALVRGALAPARRARVSKRVKALAAVLLDFHAWQVLNAAGLSTQEASVIVGDALAKLHSNANKDHA